MQILDDTGGFVVYRDGERVVFVDRGTRWTVWLRFVLALVTGILGLNAIIQLALAPSGQGSVLVAAVLVPVSILAGLVLARVHRHARREQARALTEHRPLLIIDLADQQLLGPQGQALAALKDVSFSAVFQATSSAKALECRWPGGRKIVHRGGGMGIGGVDGAVHALAALGVRAR